MATTLIWAAGNSPNPLVATLPIPKNSGRVLVDEYLAAKEFPGIWRTGVAKVFGLNFSGFLAWWLWRTIYLFKLPRLEKKMRVALDWTLEVSDERTASRAA